MARLASQAKAGFYPTPDSVVSLLERIIFFKKDSRALDPCCGYGNTLSQLASPDTATYGVELDHQRATKAKSQLFKAVWGDALTEARISSQSFGLLYLNPPYDTAINSDDNSDKRLEHQFLRTYIRTLQIGGILVFVIPYYVLKHCAKTLARHFTLQVAGFPDEDFHTFKQCIVFGEKKVAVTAGTAKENQEMLERLAAMTPEEFQYTIWPLNMMAPIEIPKADRPVNFRIDRLDPLEAIPVINKAGILQDVLKELIPTKNNNIRPLTSLENGHLALMLAGGYMNGAIEKDGRQLVIKGVIHKTEKIVQTNENGDGGGSITTKDQYVPTVKIIDMQTAELITVQ
ncbi:MAG: DUF6094 domain-containing protein [Desulfobulbaceae bacterium]|nr:DUF6094 domain-containing protein [Desulfobulbaceae bacterium]